LISDFGGGDGLSCLEAKAFQPVLWTRSSRSISGPGRSAWKEEEKGRKFMPLVQVLITLIVVGVLLWLVNRFIPMQGSIKSILNGVVVIAVVLWLLNVFGLFHSLGPIHVG
jgi:hypothetical protein